MKDELKDRIAATLEENTRAMDRKLRARWSDASAKWADRALDSLGNGDTKDAETAALIAIECAKMASNPRQELRPLLKANMDWAIDRASEIMGI